MLYSILVIIMIIIVIHLIKTLFNNMMYNSYNRVFNEFIVTYKNFDDNTLKEWRYGLEDDLAFNDNNPYNLKMLLLIDAEIENRLHIK